MENNKVKFLPEAYKDLDSIFDYILLDSKANAEIMLEKIINSIGILEFSPYLGKLIDHRSLIYYNFRMIIVTPYIVFYKNIDDTIYIYRILHGASDYIRILEY